LDPETRLSIGQDEQNTISISLLLWSFATLGYNPLGGRFVVVANERLLPLCADMDSSDITKILSSLAKMKVSHGTPSWGSVEVGWGRGTWRVCGDFFLSRYPMSSNQPDVAGMM